MATTSNRHTTSPASVCTECTTGYIITVEMVVFSMIIMMTSGFSPSSSHENRIEWIPPREPIILEKPLQFGCRIASSDPVKRLAWYSSDENIKAIAVGNSSFFPEKYNVSVVINGNITEYYIKIKHVGPSDINQAYTCEADYDRFTEKISEEKNIIIYKPTPEFSQNANGDVRIEIDMVFPRPECDVFLGDRNITESVDKAIERHHDSFYEATYSIYFTEITLTKCHNNVSLVCQISAATFTFPFKNINMCKDIQTPNLIYRNNGDIAIVFEQVYRKPDCNMFLGDVNITDSVEISLKRQKDLFYGATFSVSLNAISLSQCHNNIILACEIGPQTFTFPFVNVSMCRGNIQFWNIWPVGSLLAVVTAIYIGALLITTTNVNI